MLPSLPADRHDGHHGDDYGENECSEQDQLDRDGDVAIDVNHLTVHVPAMVSSQLM